MMTIYKMGIILLYEEIVSITQFLALSSLLIVGSTVDSAIALCLRIVIMNVYRSFTLSLYNIPDQGIPRTIGICFGCMIVVKHLFLFCLLDLFIMLGYLYQHVLFVLLQGFRRVSKCDLAIDDPQEGIVGLAHLSTAL
ncbi:hypothetical protein TVAGG3_0410610 [Trichomonas vaginalis G3]|uniref:hypothetical protein n=1 Tax=Trichomonas vaginalis (strain ATCC PRA-98 / G3) TaxID=412133 RepID=UPI0021E57069|nr:hypothetical protein TVAGG3_0410610 [Trichomonas vaginalis G3]KAI5535317.1 hypothetical protein TVAGG3_0410610 [Trichomonas vaginalis G3]